MSSSHFPLVAPKKRGHPRSSLAAAAAAVVLGLGGCASPAQWRLDATVDKLCEKNGGYKVYEVVTLPSEMFDSRNGLPRFLGLENGKLGLGRDYELFSNAQQDRAPAGHPAIRIETEHTTVVRKSDGKLLGELINYRRDGDESDSPFPPTFHQCKEGGDPLKLIRLIFKNNNK